MHLPCLLGNQSLRRWYWPRWDWALRPGYQQTSTSLRRWLFLRLRTTCFKVRSESCWLGLNLKILFLLSTIKDRSTPFRASALTSASVSPRDCWWEMRSFARCTTQGSPFKLVSLIKGQSLMDWRLSRWNESMARSESVFPSKDGAILLITRRSARITSIKMRRSWSLVLELQVFQLLKLWGRLDTKASFTCSPRNQVLLQSHRAPLWSITSQQRHVGTSSRPNQKLVIALKQRNHCAEGINSDWHWLQQQKRVYLGQIITFLW